MIDELAFWTLWDLVAALAAKLLHFDRFAAMLLALGLLMAAGLIVGILTRETDNG